MSEKHDSPDCKALLAAAIHCRKKLPTISENARAWTEHDNHPHALVTGILDLLLELFIAFIEKILTDKTDDEEIKPPPKPEHLH